MVDLYPPGTGNKRRGLRPLAFWGRRTPV